MKSGSEHARRSAQLLCAVGCLVVLAGPAAAQQPAPASKDAAAAARSQNLLHERNRAAMHPGEPLKVVGLEQNDNDIRSSTPLLAQSDRVAARVDPNENYQRTLAIYADGASFHQPLSTLSSSSGSMHQHPTSHVGSADAPENESSRPQGATQSAGDSFASDWPWLLGIGLSALLVLTIQKRFSRPALKREPGRSRTG